tara:strand:- start:188 stop:448 length:261 start_codon:yes stop_codon:yes gene_type:complete
MKCSVEISMYPLKKKYNDHIICFIKNLRNYKNIEVISNGMSTQIFGDYDNLITIVNKEIKLAFKSKNKIVFNLKIVNSDLSKLEDF